MEHGEWEMRNIGWFRVDIEELPDLALAGAGVTGHLIID